MAQLIPKASVNEITHGSERAVAKALLDTLDDEWMVYHSYPWLRTDGRKLRMGEADFVLLHPKWGLLVVEVKGGHLHFEPGTQSWFRGTKELKESPFEQARRNLFALIDQIRKSTRLDAGPHSKLPCPYGYSVVFPDCRADGTAPPGGHDAVMVDANSLHRIGPLLHDALRKWAGGKTPTPLTKAQLQAMRDGLLSTFRLVPSLASQLDREAETLIQLTDRQGEALEGLYENDRVLVEGVAGSGKTLLAVARAQAYSREGKSVLMVCYNRKLAEHLRRRVNDPNIVIRHFHGLAAEVCKKAFGRFEVPTGAGHEFWVGRVPEMVQDALDELPDFRFDALVIDEGQDFYEDWFIVLEDFSKSPPGPLYVFYDRAQNIYGATLRFPDHQTRYRLGKSCRNTRRIAEACGRTIGTEIAVADFCAEGKDPKVMSYKSGPELREALIGILDNLVKEEKLDRSRVAILSSLRPENSALGSGKIGSCNQTDDVETWQAGKAVWFSTIKAFKGLEADILILIELPDFNDLFTKSDLYVACSRARHRLLIFSNSSQVRDLVEAGAVPLPSAGG